MRIIEAQVTRYGPLVDTPRHSFSPFSLVFGKNETGKTLIVDAIIRMLLRGKSKWRCFAEATRVDADPEGYLLIGHAGKEYKLPEQSDDFAEVGIRPEDCRNIFIVRDGDLKIPDEAAFYSQVADRLTGLQSGAIEKIVKEIRKSAFLTDGGMLKNTADDNRLKDRIGKAKELLGEIEILEGRLEEERYGDLELGLARLEIELGLCLEKIRLQEAARKRKRYENGSEALRSLKSILDELTEVAAFSHEDRDAWRDAEKEIARLKNEIRSASESLGDLDEKMESCEKVHAAAAAELNQLEAREQDVLNLGLQANHVAEQLEAKAAQEKHLLTAGWGALASGIVCVVALLIFWSSGTQLALVLSLILGLVGFGLFGWRIFLGSQIGQVSRKVKELIHDASRIGIKGEGLVEILREVGEFENRVKNSRDGERSAQNALTSIKANKDQASEAIKKSETEKRKQEEILEDLKSKSGLKKLAQYAEKLESKTSLEKKLEVQKSAISNLFGECEGLLDSKIEFWEGKVAEFAIFENDALDVVPDETGLEELRNEEESKREATEDIKVSIEALRAELGQIGSRAAAALVMDETLLCETMSELHEVKKRLGGFVHQVETCAENANAAIDILEDINAEETEKVAALFGEGKDASIMFQKITDGVYEKVEFDREKGCIWTNTKELERVEARMLSKGTYDQLYLAIRLAMAKNILAGEPGFFILDDPFLSSDPDRLLRQIDLLRGLVNKGWQVIYFSVKDEVKKALASDIKGKKVKLIKLESIHR